MIREINRSEIPECVVLIRESFLTVANAFNFTQTNAPGFTAFSTSNERLYWQYDNENRKMFAFFPKAKSSATIHCCLEKTTNVNWIIYA